MKYDIAVIDPAWPYNSRANHKTRFRGGSHGHYKSMTMKDIKAMDVSSIMAPRSIVYLWATMPLLDKGIETLKGWGFTYKTSSIWVKLNKKNGKPFFGVGYYMKSNAEIILMGVRGRAMKPAVDTVSGLIMTPRGAHSQKPEEFQDRVDLMYPDHKKIELFARREREGYKCLGWELTGNDIAVDIANEAAL